MILKSSRQGDTVRVELEKTQNGYEIPVDLFDRFAELRARQKELLGRYLKLVCQDD